MISIPSLSITWPKPAVIGIGSSLSLITLDFLFQGKQILRIVFSVFFQDLWSPRCRWSFQDLVKALPSDHNSISAKDCSCLTKPISYIEILSTIKSMAKGKSPRPNGLNVEFYLFYWGIIKKPLFRAIFHFFLTATLPSSWGKTFIFLIPKSNKPKTVTDFRTISLCNVSYKIILKILTNHLKHVMHKLIGQE